MSSPHATNLPADMIAKLPDGTYGAECADGDFAACGHWVHGTRSPEGNVIMSGEFAAFVRGKAAEKEGDARPRTLRERLFAEAGMGGMERERVVTVVDGWLRDLGLAWRAESEAVDGNASMRAAGLELARTILLNDEDAR